LRQEWQFLRKPNDSLLGLAVYHLKQLYMSKTTIPCQIRLLTITIALGMMRPALRRRSSE
jgi:hypothetical protein